MVLWDVLPSFNDEDKKIVKEVHSSILPKLL